MDYGDYNIRKQELMQKGRIWFQNRFNKWMSHKCIPEKTASNEISVRYPEGKTFHFGDTIIRCTEALFHGIEFSRVGWVFSTIIEHNHKKFIHTSDLCGPMIEDYAEFIIQENPDILILDGPMTYMFGYMLTRINLRRCIENAVRIIRETDCQLIIYDHHLTRDKHYKKYTKDVWKNAKDCGTTLLTAAEYLGRTPVVLQNF
jgi:predicted metallo-beta-lactamase superfamily hydrolase